MRLISGSLYNSIQDPIVYCVLVLNKNFCFYFFFFFFEKLVVSVSVVMESNGRQFEVSAWKSSVKHILTHYQHYLMKERSEIKTILFYDVIKYFVENNGDLSTLECCLSNLLQNMSIFVKNQRFVFHMLTQYTCSDVVFENLPQSIKQNYCIWKQTIDKWHCLQPNSEDEIVVVFTPHMGKGHGGNNDNNNNNNNNDGNNDDDNNNNNNVKENDYHCRLIVSIFVKNTESVFGLYDCNGTMDDCNVSRNAISSLHSLMIGNLTIKHFQKYQFLKGMTQGRTCLHGMGHFLNQWIRFYTSSNQAFSQSCCYFFTIWSIVGVTVAIIWNKYKFVSYLSKLKSLEDREEIKYTKHDLVLLLSYDMQMLFISRIILDARQPVLYQVSNAQLFGLKNQTIYKGARIKQKKKKHNHKHKSLPPAKQFAIFTPRDRQNKCTKLIKKTLFKKQKQKANFFLSKLYIC